MTATAAARPAARPSAPFRAQSVFGAVSAPERAAESPTALEAIEHLDWEPACEIREGYPEQECGRTPVTHRFVPEPSCGHMLPFLTCKPHTELLDDGRPVEAQCRECGALVQFKAVPL